jgi:hypothetical protein
VRVEEGANMKTYTCPVCGYDGLPLPPEDWSICPCCSCEFGYSDNSWTHEELREEWVANGMQWHHLDVPKPENWLPTEQLKNVIKAQI